MDKPDIPLLGSEEPPQNDLQEWMLLRAEERILRRVTARFAMVAGLLVLLAVAGLFLFRARLESTLLATLSRSATESLERDSRQHSEKQLAELQEEVGKLRARVQELVAETERQQPSTEERLQQVERRLTDSIERQRGERAEEVKRLTERTEELSRARSEQTAASLEQLKTDLAGREQLGSIVGASLPRKLEVLSVLRMDPRDKDAQVRRTIAVLILKDLADAELVRTENLEGQVRKVLGRLSEDRWLRDDMFREVRVRTLRAAAELRLVDIASARSADPAAWERRSWILLLGALGEAAGLPPLASIAGNGKEPAEIRAAALRALASYRIAGTVAREGGPWADEEIAALAPIRGGTPVIAPDRPEVRQALRATMGVVANRRESPVLRRAALAALGRIGNDSVVGELRLVLYEEWAALGEEVIQALTGIGGGSAISLLRDFALAPLGGTELRLRAISGLQTLGGRRSLAALDRISQEVADDELIAAAQRALVALEEHMGSGSVSRNTGDLRPPRAPR